jgi:protein-arginine kinase activator protein McsA
MRKYICDRCGKVFDSETCMSSPVNGYEESNLWVLTFHPSQSILHSDVFKIGEYCDKCHMTLVDIISEAVI